jgi:hypothetical protein
MFFYVDGVSRYDSHLDCDSPCVTTSTSTTTTTIPAGPIVESHMMTFDPKQGSGCESPAPVSTFLTTDEAAYNWVMVRNTQEGDVRKWTWYRPDGEMHQTADAESGGSGNLCMWHRLRIKDYQAANYPGRWTVDFYYNDDHKFTDIFTIAPDPTATTTTTTIPSSGCAASTLYGEDSEEVRILRRYRDEVLAKTAKGRALIKLYYKFSPFIVERMEEDPEFREQVKRFCDLVAKSVENQK